MNASSSSRNCFASWMAAILSVLLAAMLPGCSGGTRHARSGGDADSGRSGLDTDITSDLTAEAGRWADSVAASMTERHRVGQLFMPAAFSRADEASLLRLRRYAEHTGVCGIVLLKGDLASVRTIADTLAACSPAGMIVAIDAETGLGMRLSDAPRFPWPSRIPPGTDEDAMFDYGAEIARECRLAGVDMVLGPVLDVAPEGSRTQFALRSFGASPERVARLGTAYARGLESGGVMSVAKHFPGHGRATADSHRTLVSISCDSATFSATDLLPFRRYCDSGFGGILVGHLWIEAVDGVKRPASVSPMVIERLLKREMGFRGLVLTDALNMAGAEGYTSVDAIKAGADIIVAPSDTEREIDLVMKAMESGLLSRDTVAARCRKVLFHKYLAGISGRRRTPPEVRAGLADEVGRGAPEVLMRISGGK